MRKWSDSKSFPYESELPDVITFPEDFWKKVIQLYKYTKGDGHERAISVFWADGDLVLSSVVKGDKKSVTPKANVKVSYTASTNKGYYTKKVFLNDKVYSKRDVYEKKVPKNGIEVKYLFNMHTHPPHKTPDGRDFYSFFSLQDLKSLLISNVVITGMIGDKFWLLMRTNQTPSVLNNFEEKDISPESLTEQLKLGVYTGDFKGKLVRVGKPQ